MLLYPLYKGENTRMHGASALPPHIGLPPPTLSPPTLPPPGQALHYSFVQRRMPHCHSPGSLSSRYRTEGVCLLSIERRRKLDCQTARLPSWHTPTLPLCLAARFARVPGCQSARLHDCQIEGARLLSIEERDAVCPLYIAAETASSS